MTKGDFSMQSVKTLFKLDLKSRFGSVQKIGFGKRLLKLSNGLFFAVVYAVILLAVYYMLNMFVRRSGLRIEFLTIVSFVTILLALFICTGSVIKNLYQNGDNELLLRFPVSGKEILFSKIIYVFLQNFVVCFFMMLPIFIMFGVVTNAKPGDYFAYIAITIFQSLIPFFIGNIIAVPCMKVMNFVKNQFFLILILTILVICGAFVLYLVSLQNVLVYLKDTNSSIFSADVIERIQKFANASYPFRWFAEIAHGKKYGALSSGQLGLDFLYLFLITAALGVLAFFVTVKEYYKTILYGIETEKSSFRKKIKNKQLPVWYALFKREFYLILRSFNYSFQYFAMACAAPVMVFFCNRLAASAGEESLGTAIMPGLTLMVITIFVAIIVSFSSNSISREGACFYHTKIIPVSFKKQITVKFLLYSIVATLSVAISCLISGVYYQSDAGGNSLTSLDIGAIFGISEMIVIALTCLSMIADVKMPTFNVVGDGEIVSANKNVALAMLVGMLVAIGFGFFAMIFSFLPLSIGSWEVIKVGDMSGIYSILAIFSALLMIGSVLGLFINIEKNYRNIVS